MSDQPEQLTLPLEYHTYDHYTIELRKGAVGAMEVMRSNTAKSVDDAEHLIDAFRENAIQREGVTWQGDEVDNMGSLYGMAYSTVWQISCVPPLTEPLTPADPE
jgi:hypothetical protein